MNVLALLSVLAILVLAAVLESRHERERQLRVFVTELLQDLTREFENLARVLEEQLTPTFKRVAAAVEDFGRALRRETPS